MKEKKKPKTKMYKGKRYKCGTCKKRSPKKILKAPYFCSDGCLFVQEESLYNVEPKSIIR